MKKIIIFFLIWITTILVVNKLSVNFIPNRTSYELPPGINISARFTILPFLNFDGRNYLDIATKGYFQKGIYNLRGFPPFYPLLINLISLTTKINPVYTGLLISFFATIGSIYLFYRLVEKEYNKKKASKAVILLLTFPASFYLLCYYTDPLYLLLSLLVFWFLRKKNFTLAAIFAAFASATRITGLVLAIIVIFEGIRYFLEKKKFPWVVILSPLGFIGLSVYNWITVNDPLAYFHAQPVYGKVFSIFGPVAAVVSGLRNVIAGPQSFFDSPFVYPVSILEFVSFVFFVSIIILTHKKIKLIYWIYMVFNLYLFLAGGILQAFPRYILVMFPIYFFLAKKLNGVWFIIYNIVSGTLLILLAALFLRGYYVA